MASIDIFLRFLEIVDAGYISNEINPYMHFENIHIIIFDFQNKQVKQLNIHTVTNVQITIKMF